MIFELIRGGVAGPPSNVAYFPPDTGGKIRTILGLGIGDQVAGAVEGGVDRGTGAVDDRIDASRAVQELGERVVELHAGSIGAWKAIASWIATPVLKKE
jgi:hypothetical protein